MGWLGTSLPALPLARYKNIYGTDLHRVSLCLMLLSEGRTDRLGTDTMAYSSHRTERELSSYYVKGEHTDGAAEYPLEYNSYTEYEGAYEFYHERTYYFTDADGVAHEWPNEDSATEWLEANGYTDDY
jgi:hypothetical protein